MPALQIAGGQRLLSVRELIIARGNSITPVMFVDPAIRSEIEADRAAGFPDPAETVRRLHAMVGVDMSPGMSLTDNADAWWLGYVEFPIGRICKGIEVEGDMREIAVWVDPWWDELREKLP